MTSTKKKLVTSLVSLCAVLVVAAVTFTAVWAARNATANSEFTIQYTALQVKATVTGSYITNTNATPTNLTVQGGEGTTITFSGSEATNGTANVKAFTSVTPVLTESGNPATAWVEFVYVITNTEESSSQVTMDIALNSNPDTNNDNLTYTYSVALGSGSSATTGNAYNNLVTGLEAGKSATITIRATVDDLDDNVNANGTFAFVLTGVRPSA